MNASTFTVLLCFKNTLLCTIIQNMCCRFIKKNQYILITFPLHKSPYKMTKNQIILNFRVKWKAQQSQVLYQKNAQRVGRGLHQMPQASRRSRDFICRRFNSFFLFCYNTNIYKMWKPRKKIQRNYHPGHNKSFSLKFFLICGSSIMAAAGWCCWRKGFRWNVRRFYSCGGRFW